MLLSRGHPNLCNCIGLFDTAEIAVAIKCICTAWFFVVCLSVCLLFFILILYFMYDFTNKNNNIIIIIFEIFGWLWSVRPSQVRKRRRVTRWNTHRGETGGDPTGGGRSPAVIGRRRGRWWRGRGGATTSGIAADASDDESTRRFDEHQKTWKERVSAVFAGPVNITEVRPTRHHSSLNPPLLHCVHPSQLHFYTASPENCAVV